MVATSARAIAADSFSIFEAGILSFDIVTSLRQNFNLSYHPVLNFAN